MSTEKKKVFNPEHLEDLLNYELLLDMEVLVTVDLGATKVPVREFIAYEKGAVIDLMRAAGESVEISVNGRIIGKGEVMVYEKNLAIRINEILDSDAVLQYLSKEEEI